MVSLSPVSWSIWRDQCYDPANDILAKRVELDRLPSTNAQERRAIARQGRLCWGGWHAAGEEGVGRMVVERDGRREVDWEMSGDCKCVTDHHPREQRFGSWISCLTGHEVASARVFEGGIGNAALLSDGGAEHRARNAPIISSKTNAMTFCPHLS